MKSPKTPYSGSTREWLYGNIVKFLDANTEHGWLDDEAFGWMACRDSGLVARLQNKGDTRTDNMDAILAFIQNPIPPEKWKKAVLTPVTINRRVYE